MVRTLKRHLFRRVPRKTPFQKILLQRSRIEGAAPPIGAATKLTVTANDASVYRVGPRDSSAGAFSGSHNPSVIRLRNRKKLQRAVLKLLEFSKASRIRTSEEFRTVLDNGNKWVRPEIVVFVLPTSGTPTTSRLGLIVSRKVGKAHDRNLVKRRLREIFRTELRETLVANADIVVIARERAARSDYATLSKSFVGGVSKAFSLKRPSTPSRSDQINDPVGGNAIVAAGGSL